MNTRILKLLGAIPLVMLASCASNTPANSIVIGPSGKPVDVSGIPEGTLVEDPNNGTRFRVGSAPGISESQRVAMDQEYRRSTEREKPKSAFASALGSVLGGAVGAVGVVAQNQLNSASSSSGSSYNANSAATSQTQGTGTEYTGMLGLSELGAASGPVSVVFRASENCKGNAIVHSSVAQKYSWVIAKGYASGYGRTVNGSTGYHTDNFEIMFNKNGPYTKQGLFWTNGNWDFHRGLKVVNITSVNYIK